MDKIESFVRKNKNIVHGRRALNAQLPAHLHRTTNDWDLFCTTCQEDADKLASQLGPYYTTQTIPLTQIDSNTSGQKVYRVVDKFSGQAVADFIKKPKAKNLYVVISGIRYETLDHAKQIYKKILRNPQLMARHSKAQYDLYTIEEFERQLKGKKEINRVPSGFQMFQINPHKSLGIFGREQSRNERGWW